MCVPHASATVLTKAKPTGARARAEAGAWAWLGTADKCKRHFRQRKSENGSKLNAQNLKGNRETRARETGWRK